MSPSGGVSGRAASGLVGGVVQVTGLTVHGGTVGICNDKK